MKILVVGSVPPPDSGHRRSLLVEVLRLRREGHDVEILSLDPLSVAHRFLAAPGVPSAFEVGLAARRFDALVLQLEPGLPVRHAAGRAERVAALSVLARLLRPHANVTLRLEHPDDLPGGHGGRAAIGLWAAVGAIEVGSEAMREELADLLGSLGDRVSVASADGAEAGVSIAPLAWSEGADATAAQVQAVVRARAAAERQSLAARGRLHMDGAPSSPRVPQWEWLPSPGAGVPDLGPVRRDGEARGRRRTGSPATSRRSPSLRHGVTAALAAAERRPATRPAAQVVRLAYLELRSVLRRVS